MELSASNVISTLSACIVAVMGFIIREKNKLLDDHSKSISDLGHRLTVQETAAHYRDERIESMDGKLDKILEKLEVT